MGYTPAEVIGLTVGLCVILALGLIFRYTLREAPTAVRHLPLTILGATIVILEVVKQIYHVAYGDWYPWHLPLHFCSFFLVWYAIAVFTRGNIRQLMYFCSLAGGILVTLLMLLAPRWVIHDACSNFFGRFDAFHTYVFHLGVVAYWVWMLMLGLYQPQRHHIYQTVILHTIFYFFILAGAYIFNTNYTNVLHGDIAFLENMRLAVGQFFYTVILLAFGIAIIALVAAATYFAMHKLRRPNPNQEPSNK